ncbi:hypothetical protein TcWFU_008909 [Taenia crassiceps]|uniref:Uncharacterized protein n=1 Tax=Taenia crassiceps TaxID=6207 RepID=A0ABR4Q0W8_9CEST
MFCVQKGNLAHGITDNSSPTKGSTVKQLPYYVASLFEHCSISFFGNLSLQPLHESRLHLYSTNSHVIQASSDIPDPGESPTLKATLFTVHRKLWNQIAFSSSWGTPVILTTNANAPTDL